MLMLRTPFPCGSSVPQVAKAIYLVQISINYKIWLANDKKESDCGQRVIDPPDVGEKIVALIDSRCGRLLHRHVSAMDAGAVESPTIQRSQVMQITTFGMDIAKSGFSGSRC
jgi:hypothetical protein